MTDFKAEDIQAIVKELLGEEVAEIRKAVVALSEEKAENAEADAAKEAAAVEQYNKRKFAYHPFDDGEAPNPNKGIGAGRWLRLMVAGKGDPERAARIAKSWGDDYMAKALNESVFEAGGALIPEVFAGEVTELLRERSVVRASGVRSIPMNNGSLTIPYQSAATTAQYDGELDNIAPSQPRFGQMTLSAKKLTCLVPMSNDLLADASPDVDRLVRDDMVRSMALREDLAFLRGDGTGNSPQGMLNIADASNKFDSAGSTVANKVADSHDALLLLREKHIPATNLRWYMSPRTRSRLSRTLDQNDNFIFQAELRAGMYMGIPVWDSTQIPTNLGGGGDESEMYLVDIDPLVIAESSSISVAAFEGGAYHDGNSVVSGISTDQTVLRAIARHDFGARQRGQEIVVVGAVNY